MKNISTMIFTCILMSFPVFSHAHQLDQNIQNILIADDKKYSFDFDDFDVNTLKVLLEAERQIKVDISEFIDTENMVRFKAKEINFLDYLQKGADSLNLEVIQLGASRIMLIPKK